MNTNDGNGTFHDSTYFSETNGGWARCAAIDDLNGDGAADVVIVGAGTNQVFLNANDGKGTMVFATGAQYEGVATELHVGYEGEITEGIGYFVEGGATVISPDGEESNTVPSAKIGGSAALTDSLGLYTEINFLGSGDKDLDRSYGAKIGARYSF